MRTASRLRRCRIVAAARLCLFCAMIGTGGLYGQITQFDAERLESARHRLEQGHIFGVDSFELAKAGAVEAIPGLEQQFKRSLDVRLKDSIASALVRLGDKDQTYWDYLKDRTEAAINSTAPFPMAFDSHGQFIPKQLTPTFMAWAKAHFVSPEEESAAQIYEAPGPVLQFGSTHDSRGRALLQRALLSPNYYIQHAGARGLALLQDKDSIPLIIEACGKAPAAMAEMIALPLVAFNDRRAESAIEMFVRNRALLDAQRDELRKYGIDKLL